MATNWEIIKFNETNKQIKKQMEYSDHRSVPITGQFRWNIEELPVTEETNKWPSEYIDRSYKFVVARGNK